MADSELQARLIPLDRLEEGDIDAWHTLGDRAVEPNPFFRAEFVLAGAPGREPPELLVASEGDDWRGCLPVHRSRWRRVPVRCLGPWMPEYTFYGAPLLDARDAEGAAQALLERAVAERSTGLLVIDQYDPTAPAGRAIGAALENRWLTAIPYENWERAALRRRPEGGYLEAATKSRKRKELRRSRRRLEDELGGELSVRDGSADPAAWEEFLALEGASWKARTGTALTSSEQDAAFFRRMCEALAERGRLQVLALEGGGRTAAMQVNILDGRALYGFKVAYDEALSRHSPGALLEIDAMQVFHDSGAELLDTCAHADSALLNRLYADRRPIATTLVRARGPRGRLAAAAARTERFARRLRARRRGGGDTAT